MGPSITVDQLSMTYGGRRGGTQALDDIQCKVSGGEFVSIVGPSGCGKSTLLRILVGLETRHVGRVTYSIGSSDLRAAFVPQDAALFPWRSLMQNAAIGIEIRRRVDSDSLLYIRELIGKYRLQGFENALPSELSGGMRQRAAIIRALAARPNVLFCDEPFSAIDFVTRLELNAVFKQHSRVGGMTTVMATHNIDDAIFLSDRILVMSARPGKVIREFIVNLPEAVITDPVAMRDTREYTELFHAIWRLLG